MKEIILDSEVILPEKVTLEVYNVGTENQPSYVLNETTARYILATHTKCSSCENPTPKSRTHCEECSSKISLENYKNKVFREWDGVTPLCLYNSSTYFFDEDGLQDYIVENDLHWEDLQLMICTPNHVNNIGVEYFMDEFPECFEELKDFDKGLDERLTELNKYIDSLKPVSWSEGSFRTEYKP